MKTYTDDSHVNCRALQTTVNVFQAEIITIIHSITSISVSLVSQAAIRFFSFFNFKVKIGAFLIVSLIRILGHRDIPDVGLYDPISSYLEHALERILNIFFLDSLFAIIRPSKTFGFGYP